MIGMERDRDGNAWELCSKCYPNRTWKLTAQLAPSTPSAAPVERSTAKSETGDFARPPRGGKPLRGRAGRG